MWAKLKHLLWQQRGVWIATPTIAGLVIAIRFLGLLQSWEWGAYDQYLRLRPTATTDERILIVGIDELDVQKLGQANISDGIYAQLIEKLKAMKPRAIGLDIYRDQPVEPGHQQLVRVFNSTPDLVGIQKVVGSDREAIGPPPALKAKGQVGANDIVVDADNKVRRGLIYVKNNETIYSFGLYLALIYLDKEGIKIEPSENPKIWRLGNAVYSPFQSNDGGYIRADDRGYQILINYRGHRRHFQTVSMTDILENKVSPELGRDRVILIGKVGDSFNDLFFTPYSSGLINLPERTAGVEIHANLISQIINAAIGDRSLIKSWSEPTEWLWILFWSGVGAVLSWELRYVGGVNRFLVRRLTTGLLAAAILLSITYAALLWGWWIPVIPPMLALYGSTISIVAYIAQSAGDIRKTFGRYLTDQVVANLLENPEGLKLGGERRKITILTSDLRGFTATSERLPPEEVIKIINLYLGYMADVITQYQGTIDEFMGDGILVLFGAPTAREDDAIRSIACAVAMQLAMQPVNAKMQEWGLPPLEMGIGINTGEVVVGNIGSDKRTKYGIVGSQVNLTYRIESFTLGGQVFISESTFKEVESIVKIYSERQVQLKGVKEPVTIYEIEGILGEYNLFLPQEEDIFIALPEEIPIQYAILDGKHIDETIFKASIVELSAKGAKVHCQGIKQDLIPAGLTNIKLNLLQNETLIVSSEDVYAKTLEKVAENNFFYISFTSMPPDVKANFEQLYKSISG